MLRSAIPPRTMVAVGEVLVLLEGEPTPMPLPDGELVDRPVTASDYADLVVP